MIKKLASLGTISVLQKRSDLKQRHLPLLPKIKIKKQTITWAKYCCRFLSAIVYLGHHDLFMLWAYQRNELPLLSGMQEEEDNTVPVKISFVVVL